MTFTKISGTFLPKMTLFFFSIFSFLFLSASLAQNKQTVYRRHEEKTTFQTGAPWDAAIDLRSDAAIVYGEHNSFGERVQSWRKHGYVAQFMTGIAWGHYTDFFTGKFDGKKHIDDGQVDSSGNIIWHPQLKDVPYIVPSESYLKYIESLLRKVIDHGITTIYLEEPEFFARSGYSESFKKAWKKYYGFDWEPENRSPDATYLSSKLKFHLYLRALGKVFRYAKAYGRSKGKHITCFVATHSLPNYSSWEVVSPEAGLATIPQIDGYVAQVWSNTAEVPNYYNGVKKSRTFETAFVEYGSMESMAAPTGRTIYFLTDPVGDDFATWPSYRRTYEETFTAELMYPMVDHFEVIPWPTRVFLGKFRPSVDKKPVHIPPAYATQVEIMINSLNSMPLSHKQISGTKGIGVLLGNSLMFQRFPTYHGYSDPQLSDFYGMVLPLIKRGIPVKLVNMENLSSPNVLENIKVLVMSYSDMKPLSPDVHEYLAAWVKKGGVLIYYGKDNDPYQRVTEWWDTGTYHYAAPSDELFHQMHITLKSGRTRYSYGRGKVYIVREDPKELVLNKDGDRSFVGIVKHAFEVDANGGKFRTRNYFYLQRGPYDIAAVMNESEIMDTSSLLIKGPVIDLFNPSLPVLEKKVVYPGQEAFLYDLARVKDKKKPQVLCAASRVYNERVRGNSYSFLTKSPSHTMDAMRILLPHGPAAVRVNDSEGNPVSYVSQSWDRSSHTLLLKFENSSAGIKVQIKY